MKILIISGEYPPMKGGVGRYTSHLVEALCKKRNLEVHIGLGNFQPRKGISPPPSTAQSMSYNNHENCSVSSNNDIDKRRNYHHNIIKKGDRKNSDRLLDLIQELKPDIVNVQYERGLYEVDTSIFHMSRRIIHGSTLNRFFMKCNVPTISTLHTVLPYDEYQEYIRERALRKEGRFAALPPQLRAPIRRWVLKRRYELLFDVVRVSDELISLAKTIQEIVRRGTVIYHGAEPASSLVSSKYKSEYRKEFGLPDDKRLLLAFGYIGSYKGFDILDTLNLPEGWSLVVKQNTHERGVEKPIHLRNNAINLDLGHIDDITLSKIFFACDAIILPYKVVSVSGVLFDALAHGLPFIASDLRFFKEFSALDLGITCNRSASAISESISSLDSDYDRYKKNIQGFSPTLKWSKVADSHIELYSKLVSRAI
jgi:glycosyltransferase involved in cell wall biosynthesis